MKYNFLDFRNDFRKVLRIIFQNHVNQIPTFTDLFSRLDPYQTKMAASTAVQYILPMNLLCSIKF